MVISRIHVPATVPWRKAHHSMDTEPVRRLGRTKTLRPQGIELRFLGRSSHGETLLIETSRGGYRQSVWVGGAFVVVLARRANECIVHYSCRDQMHAFI